MKNWKHSIIGILIIFTIVFAACSKKSETQTAAATTANSHEKILNGDTSALAGKWHIRDRVNCAEEQHYNFNADGSYINSFPYRPSENGTWNLNGNILTTQYQEAAMDGIGGYVTVSFQLIIKNHDNIDLIYQNDRVIELTRCNIGDAAAAVSSVSYAKILGGDFSDLEGTWVNNSGNKRQLKANGTFGTGRSGNVTKGLNGVYIWPVSTGEESGFGAALYPAGIEVYNEDGQLLATDTSKIRITIGYVYSITDLYYREWEYPTSQNKSAQTALEHEELRIGSSVSGTVGGDWVEKYNIRSLETGFILLNIESDVEIYMEVYNGDQFIFSNMSNNDVIFKNAEITAKPNTVYLITVQSYVRDVTEAAFRITASFDR